MGTGTHIGAEKFNLATGIKVVHVPANTTPEAIADTVAGRSTYLITPISYALADIRAGKLRGLGVTTNGRSPLLSDVPTIAEAGVTGFDYAIWYGVWVRAGTPARVVDKLATDIARVLAAPDMRDWLAKHGADPMNMTQSEFAHFVVSESENAARIVKVAGINLSNYDSTNRLLGTTRLRKVSRIDDQAEFQLLLTSLSANLRLLFATIWGNERNGDFATVIQTLKSPPRQTKFGKIANPTWYLSGGLLRWQRLYI